MEWHLHLGAHKTATTHFQDLLQNNIPSLARSGTLFIPRAPLRASKLVNQIVERRVSGDLFGALTSKFGPGSPGQAPRPKRVLISEENILGTSKDLLESPIYSRAEKRLSAWAELLKGHDVTLYLAVRNFGQILPSAYSQAIRQGMSLQPFRYYLDRCLASPPSWFELVERIQSTFARPTIRIWTFDDYIKDPARLVGHLGVGEIESGELDVPASTRSLSEPTLHRLQQINSFKLPKLIRKKLSRYVAAGDAGAGFSPLPADEIEFFTTRYNGDLQKFREEMRLVA